MHNVTCFVLQLAHLLAQWEDKAFWIRLKRFLFFSTFQLACLFPDRGAPLLHNVPVQWVGRRGAAVDNNASGWHKVGISGPAAKAWRVDESCHMLTTCPYHCVSKLAPMQKKINPDSRKTSKSELPVVFPPLASPIYAVIMQDERQKHSLLGYFACMDLMRKCPWSNRTLAEKAHDSAINMHGSFLFFFCPPTQETLTFAFIMNRPPQSMT